MVFRIIEKIFRLMKYFRHGHSQYTAFILSLINFAGVVSLAYSKYLARIPIIGRILTSPGLFLAIFAVA